MLLCMLEELCKENNPSAHQTICQMYRLPDQQQELVGEALSPERTS